VVVIGDTLLCSRAGSVEGFSLADPARPRYLGKFGPTRPGRTQALVCCHDRLVLVGPGCLSVFDVSKPAEPQHLSTTQPQGFAWNGCAVGDRLYVAEAQVPSYKNSRDGIAIYDLADPRALKEVGFVATPASPYHLLPVGKDRLAVLMNNQAQLFSTADPLKPGALGKPVATYGRSGAVFPIDGTAYLATASDVFRVEENGLFRIGGIRAGGTPDGYPYHGCCQGGYAIVPLQQAAVVLRPEARSVARLLPPGKKGPVVPAGPPVRVGQVLDLAGPTVGGEKFDLKQLRGRVVLVDFWATWCGPCVAEMPNVKQVYDRYHKDGFEVVGVSLDSSKEALGKFLKAKEVPWPQLFFEDKEAQGWNNPLARKCGVHAIPFTILVDRAGKVVQLGVRGAALEPAVAKLLGKESGAP
jgi:thiol-disulfide isomerase/thioredoxin